MKKTYNQFPYMANLGNQVTTPISERNAEMEANRPIDVPYRMSWPREGFMTQKTLNWYRHIRDVMNSKLKRQQVK